MSRALKSLRLACAVIAAAGACGAAHAGAEPPPYTELFTRAFSPDFIATVDDSLPDEKPRNVKVYFRVSELGKLKITSGQIVGADPFVGTERAPFTQAVPNGEFPVRLAVLQGSMGRGRVALARVEFSENPAVRWAMAVVPGQDLSILKSDEIFGYPIDAGIGSFFDAETGKAASAQFLADEAASEALLEKGQNAGAKERGAMGAFRLFADMGPGNIAAFDSGWGDGVYASWFGYDADGNVAALVTDFDVIDWSKAIW
jgi:hypothetical protein